MVVSPAPPASAFRVDSAARPIGNRDLLPLAGPHVEGVRRDNLPCTYCRQPLSADSFEYLSTMRRLVSAICPFCGRQTTVRASTWVLRMQREHSRHRASAPGAKDRA
jgi:hypothetical protein